MDCWKGQKHEEEKPQTRTLVSDQEAHRTRKNLFFTRVIALCRLASVPFLKCRIFLCLCHAVIITAQFFFSFFFFSSPSASTGNNSSTPSHHFCAVIHNTTARAHTPPSSRRKRAAASTLTRRTNPVALRPFFVYTSRASSHALGHFCERDNDGSTTQKKKKKRKKKSTFSW